MREQQQRLDSLRQALEVDLQERASVVGRALDTLHSLYEVTGMPVEDDMAEVGENVTETRLTLINTKIEQAKQVIEQRKEIVVERMTELCSLHQKLKLDEDEFTPIDVLVLERDPIKIGVHCDRLKEIDDRLVELHTIKETRGPMLQEYARAITILWDRLHVEQQVRTEFLKSHTGYAQSTLTACKAELEELERAKLECMQNQIGEYREQLTALYDEAKVSQTEQDAFFAKWSNVTEESWQAHAEELQRIQEKLELMRPVLAMIGEREALIEEKREYEAMLGNKDRFKIRGRMLYEDDFRKRWKRRVKLDKTLRASLTEWESSNEPFMWNDVQYLSKMATDCDEFESSTKKVRRSVVDTKRTETKRSEHKQTAAASTSAVASTGSATPSRTAAGTRRPSTASAHRGSAATRGRTSGRGRARTGGRTRARAANGRTAAPAANENDARAAARTGIPQPSTKAAPSTSKPSRDVVAAPPTDDTVLSENRQYASLADLSQIE
jgi:Microtubule associated protein (MAP65/ASE1 family)